MELREFAEQVLFASTLDLKLAAPLDITDEHPGAPLATPAAPGRPVELQFKHAGSAKPDFPSLRELENERERGRLLHFFANHELLATELMALVLLRFPDAPADFRRGVLRTLKDEQAHTRLYVKRMRECGTQFGDLPVSGYFWRSVSPMENPMDYVSSLCLTFEQANLDFCRHFARGFEAVGDHATANLLEGIYQDEIHHVAYGLKWFRRWKNPQQSDWEAFCRQLKFPLSPQRAKGLTLNVAGRSAAGLDPEFIAELDVYSHSKGRTPGVFVFNPFAEACIAHGKKFMPVKHQKLLASDLAAIPQFLCRQDDVVLLEKRPSVEFLSSIKRAGFALPEFVGLKDGCIDPRGTLCERRIGQLRPWAWGPDSMELFKPLFGRITGENRPAREYFNEQIGALYSKTWSANFLRELLLARPPESWLCPESEVGVAVNTLEDAVKVIEQIRARGHHRIVAKEALGLAGHNAIRLWEPGLLETQRRWLGTAFENGREVVIEPWLERERDFSVQLEMGARHLTLCGFTGLLNDTRGQFQGNWAAPNFRRSLPPGIRACFAAPVDIAGRLRDLFDEIISRLERDLHGAGYIGPVGIDAFVYRTADGSCRLKPVVEINPRYTMGRLTLELMKNVCPGSAGLFRLVGQPQLRAAGFVDFVTYAEDVTKSFPLHLEGEPQTKIHEGLICLNEAARAQVCLGVFQVTRDLESLLVSNPR